MAEEPTHPQLKEEAEDKRGFMESYRDYIFPSVSFVVLALVIFLVAIPTGSSIFKNFNRISGRQDEINELEQYVKELQILSNDDDELLGDVELLTNYLPSESRVASFTDEVNKIATDAGLKRSTLSGQESVVGDDDYEKGQEATKRVVANFRFLGQLDELFEFFQDINEFKTLLSIRSVQFVQAQAEWEIDVEVASYNLPQETLDELVDDEVLRDGVKDIGDFDVEFLEEIRSIVSPN